MSKSKNFIPASGSLPIRMTNDYFFKVLMQENERAMIALICSVLHRPSSSIKTAVIQNPIILGEHVNNKTIILDVLVLFNDETYIDLEMQVINENNWPERSLYYLCRNYTKLGVGKKYKAVRPSYHIGILDYTLFKEHPEFCAEYRIQNVVSRQLYTGTFGLYVIDLTRIDLATEEDRRFGIDRWARLFKATTWEELKMIAEQDTALASAAHTVYLLSEDERIRMEAEAREDWLRRQNDLRDEIKQSKQVKKEMQKIKAENSSLKSENSSLQSENSSLRKKLKELRQKYHIEE